MLEGPGRPNLLSKITRSGSYKKIRSHASPSSPSPRQVPAQPQLPGVRRGERVTHTGAADEDHAEGLHDARDAHHPSESQEEDDTKDVLQAR